jgi:hypothetical protein
MTKDEALDLALEELENCADLLKVFEAPIDSCVGATMLQAEAAITAIKQARALDKKAENARELGLDYEPADGTQVSKVWWDGEKLMAKPIPLEDIYQPVQEPVGLIARLKNPEQHYEFTDPKKANAVLMSLCQEAADALAVPVQPMAHIVGEIDHTGKVWKPVQPAPVQEPVAWPMEEQPDGSIIPVDPSELPSDYFTTPPAQPAVPDAIHHTDLSEHPQYIEGWNDCRQAMMEMMK